MYTYRDSLSNVFPNVLPTVQFSLTSLPFQILFPNEQQQYND